ncbi:hypothetical protein ACJMK2_032098 [Sinanodonta woodiana]|uniref:F5/8 type C domain-containing protein n=1 Tax=Sinanodonta woodiana TaxID=1069815 RepID=A0ABD3X0Q0_SINWO
MRQLLIPSIIYMCSVHVEQVLALICGEGSSDRTHFGPSCEYLCHCGYAYCDSRAGKCYSGSPCDRGWMGSGCQQVNIAYNASVESHHVDNGLNVVDGIDSTCTTFNKSHGELAYVVLDLGRKVNILQVDLVNPHASGDSLLKFGISLSIDNLTFRPYYWYQTTENPPITEPVRKSDIFARFFRIEPNGTEDISTLCEIEIAGECDNFYRNCSIPCGHCAKGSQCDRISGYCDASGCADGWQTVKCDKPCNDTYYGDCMTKCGHCRHSDICDKINGSCPSSLCFEGWHGERCDKELVTYALKEPVNVGVIAGTVSAVVVVIIVIVISVVMVKRRGKTTEKEKDTSSQNVSNMEHDVSKPYYNTEDSRMQRSEPIHKSNMNGMKLGPKVSGYEILQDGIGTEELGYAVIDPSLMDNNGRSIQDNICYYNDEFSSLAKR